MDKDDAISMFEKLGHIIDHNLDHIEVFGDGSSITKYVCEDKDCNIIVELISGSYGIQGMPYFIVSNTKLGDYYSSSMNNKIDMEKFCCTRFKILT